VTCCALPPAAWPSLPCPLPPPNPQRPLVPSSLRPKTSVMSAAAIRCHTSWWGMISSRRLCGTHPFLARMVVPVGWVEALRNPPSSLPEWWVAQSLHPPYKTHRSEEVGCAQPPPTLRDITSDTYQTSPRSVSCLRSASASRGRRLFSRSVRRVLCSPSGARSCVPLVG